MNHKSYIINLDNPCNENWTSMTTIENGKYCSVCTKNVIDFTSLTDAEIIEQIEKTKGNLCGRFNNSQLNRIIEIQQKQHFGSSIYKLLTGLLFLSTANNVEAKEINFNLKTEIHENLIPISAIKDSTTSYSLKNIFKGKVLDSATREPLEGTVIYLYNKKIGTRVNNDGYFELNIKDELIEPEMIFIVRYLGYLTQEIKIEAKNLPIEKEIFLTKGKINITTMVGIPAITIQKRKWWQRKKKNCH